MYDFNMCIGNLGHLKCFEQRVITKFVFIIIICVIQVIYLRFLPRLF